jgi:D-alanyl-lipoteichoic acid acyltransferase DltB (MBOAT superfamily)|nr:MBOAT family O-acyltransferase [Kofleriaceae bacterium]
MLFSSPDYPIFLIAVFFLYALSRRAGWARAAVMVLLIDVVVTLIAKNVDALWDPLGGLLLRFVVADDAGWIPITAATLLRWLVGSAVLAGACVVGRDRAPWIASDRGQAWIARGFVTTLAAVGALVAVQTLRGDMAATTSLLAGSGHVVVLAVLGVGLGAAQRDATRVLGRVVVLFVVSALFYHAWAATLTTPDGDAPAPQYRYLLALLLGTIVLDYYLALWIERAESPWARRALVVVSLCSNLGILVFFKYADFFTQDVLHLPVARLRLILPAGISFHTFQSLSYTIDVYRKELPATKSVAKFATFVLFFPQLVAGPIVRAQDLLPQLDAPPALDLEASTRALFRIVIGLFKKIALADTLAMSIVDRVFESPGHFSAIEVLAGVYGYALQIYLDFSAYSDIAIGSATILGFDLPENFRTPYRSANLQEFWRRWHISLSTWLRDYLYKTLGGNRKGEVRTYVNLTLTMLLGGLWHGASWTFVVWGALHGFGLAITRAFQRAADPERLAMWAALAAAVGGVAHWMFLRDAGVWLQLVVAWLYLTPLWAVLTAWLGRDDGPRREVAKVRIAAYGDPTAYGLRVAMCVAGATTFWALQYGEAWTWLALALVTWLLGHAADLADTRDDLSVDWLGVLARRTVAMVLVFHYVCLAWIFFRAPDFSTALAVLSQLAGRATDHANVGPIVQIVLVVGFLAHLYADGSFAWLRERFAGLPLVVQGLVLAGVMLILRELGHAKIVPFIYFQF